MQGANWDRSTLVPTQSNLGSSKKPGPWMAHLVVGGQKFIGLCLATSSEVVCVSVGLPLGVRPRRRAM
jgi:hypothetical protein